ncbi:hypothetical protein M427DRAFT_142185 [Gonapodya prolifera JEL478]|uniref:F-box domain-containing protein n=1 Tax=Gonapodya prolifera (strain JEL478) TaxID=1344416 RepID=A0A139AYM8_GONPJ|nr:hypothetical protein M427DRAFT_142185 [Gonapodya prolifera JEL478]|eukprot:KXS21810.1 hypothetical protein M427DRAFT_142185 [Gonapodya prolifera JEL478]
MLSGRKTSKALERTRDDREMNDSSLSNLPFELILLILSQCSPRSLLVSLQYASKMFHSAVHSLLLSHASTSTVNAQQSPNLVALLRLVIPAASISPQKYKIIQRSLFSSPLSRLRSSTTSADMAALTPIGQLTIAIDPFYPPSLPSMSPATIPVSFKPHSLTISHSRPPTAQYVTFLLSTLPTSLEASDAFFLQYATLNFPYIPSVTHITMVIRSDPNSPTGAPSLRAALFSFPNVTSLHIAGRDTPPTRMITLASQGWGGGNWEPGGQNVPEEAMEPFSARLTTVMIHPPHAHATSLWLLFRPLSVLPYLHTAGFVDLLNDPWWWHPWVDTGLRGRQAEREVGTLEQVTTLLVRVTPDVSHARLPSWWSWDRRERHAVSQADSTSTHSPPSSNSWSTALEKLPLFASQTRLVMPNLRKTRFYITHRSLVQWINEFALDAWADMIIQLPGDTVEFLAVKEEILELEDLGALRARVEREGKRLVVDANEVWEKVV